MPCCTEELQSLVEHIELADLRCSGVFLTWSNNHLDDTRKYCKLDRILVNTRWLTSFDTSEAVFVQPGISYHSPGILRITAAINQRRYIFRFCDFWLQDADFENIVRTTWNISVTSTPMFILTRKLKVVKLALKKLHRNKYAKLAARVETHELALNRIHDQISQGSSYVSLYQ